MQETVFGANLHIKKRVKIGWELKELGNELKTRIKVIHTLDNWKNTITIKTQKITTMKTTKQIKMDLTKEQLIKLSKIRKELIESYNENEAVNYVTVRDLDYLIEEILEQ